MRIYPYVAFFMGVFAFIFLSSNGHPDTIFDRFDKAPLEIPVFVAPCVVFGLTAAVYMKFMTYGGPIACLSALGLLIALFCCLGLFIYQQDWWMHLVWMYSLFFSYIVWDVVMVECYLKEKRMCPQLVARCRKDTEEVNLVSAFINQPTLLTIGIIALASYQCECRWHITDDKMSILIAGVVSFHLIYSCVAYMFTSIFILRPSESHF